MSSTINVPTPNEIRDHVRTCRQEQIDSLLLACVTRLKRHRLEPDGSLPALNVYPPAAVSLEIIQAVAGVLTSRGWSVCVATDDDHTEYLRVCESKKP